ncbi:hypothetical protein O5967_21755 [Escherichia coli]|nr:hypothetical protein [Escherichia coli]MCZ5269311.1 hypothetical protein [Escherichia coli]
MEVEMWDGGLQEQEVLAIEKIKAAFSVNVSKPDKPFRSGSISEQLKAMVLSAMKCSLERLCRFSIC